MLVDDAQPSLSSASTLCAPHEKPWLSAAASTVHAPPPQHPSRRPRSLVQAPSRSHPGSRPTPTLVIHGGASGGTLPPDIPPELETSYRSALALALQRGYAILNAGGSALDAVTEAVKSMEDDELFNAGHGAVLNLKGEVECEASVMSSEPLPGLHNSSQAEQRDEKGFLISPPTSTDKANLALDAGKTHFPSPHRRYAAATGIRNTKNPITLARALYLHPGMAPHAFFAGNEAEEIGWKLGTEKVNGQTYYWTRRRWEEHRKALGLPTDVDPKGCTYEVDSSEAHSPSAPPPTYDSLTPATKMAANRDPAASYDASSIQALPGSDIGQASIAEVDRYEESTHLSARAASTRTSLDVQASGMSSSSSSGDDEKSTRADTDGNDADVDSRTSVDSHRQPPSFAPPAQRRKPFMPMGTVGAVALDAHGRVATATSTGGTTNKVPGRIGDTPSVGAGFWAETWDAKDVPGTIDEEDEEEDEDDDGRRPDGCGDAFKRALKALFGIDLVGGKARTEEKKGELGRLEAGRLARPAPPSTNGAASQSHGHRARALALSATGTGDVFLRLSFASLVSHRRKLLGQSLVGAVEQAVKEMGELEGEGGCIALGERGEVVMRCNTEAMNRGFISHRTGGKPHVAIWAKEDCKPWSPPAPAA